MTKLTIRDIDPMPADAARAHIENVIAQALFDGFSMADTNRTIMDALTHPDNIPALLNHIAHTERNRDTTQGITVDSQQPDQGTYQPRAG